ncbi:hypothetical protein [Campylobacter armoricus]|uniref:Uncharacterized protein n=1 Tax=Campylobacter armoricus TaxID=2505970 RepID=A0A7L5HJY2_9BACT|nr:hypothetical protein [Campylobacter armoricus]QKF79535.1 hypothetical protein CARM_0617 [Campylobacter armoricus]
MLFFKKDDGLQLKLFKAQNHIRLKSKAINQGLLALEEKEKELKKFLSFKIKVLEELGLIAMDNAEELAIKKIKALKEKTNEI